MNNIFRRRSIRKFKDIPVEQDKLERIISAGMHAATAKDARPWEFIVVTDAAKKKAVSKMSEFAVCAADAPVVIITLADISRDDAGRMFWVQDMSACTENMLLQIVEEGLGGVWLGLYPEEDRIDYIRDLFKLPDSVMPFSAVALGYNLFDKEPKDRFDASRIHYDFYEVQ